MSKNRIIINREKKPQSENDFFSNFEDDHQSLGPEKPTKEKAKEYSRQTFLLRKEYLDKLKDYVHTMRMNGETNYTQKQALQDALELLFDSISIIKSRPDKE